MKIAIYNNGIAFNGDTPMQRPLGGSESGIVYMARELAGYGHAVSVYNNCQEPGVFSGVRYAHYHQFFNEYRTVPWDVLVAFRSFDPLLLGRIAPRMVYWTGDASDQPCLQNFEHAALQQNLDAVFCVSNWHRDSFIRRFGLLPEKVHATRNGFAPELVVQAGTRDRFQSAYTSTPFRGLDILLELFPNIRERVANATLNLFSSMQVYGWASDKDRETYGPLYDAANQPGVSWKGSVKQPELLKHLSASGLLLYPNTFEETSCIAAIEAQASGCVPIVSAKAALRETVANKETGICVSGDPRSTQYKKEFVDAAVGVLTNPDLFGKLSEAARTRAFRLYSWRAIAAEWTAFFESMPVRPVSGRFTGPLSLIERASDYVRNGNQTAARRVLSEMDSAPFFKKEIESLLAQMNSRSQNQPAHGGA